jgi:hypothetical protein
MVEMSEKSEIEKCDDEIEKKLGELHEMENQRKKTPFTANNKARKKKQWKLWPKFNFFSHSSRLSL